MSGIENARCMCGGRHCRRCGVSVGAANAGVLCDPPFAASHDFAPPAEPRQATAEEPTRSAREGDADE